MGDLDDVGARLADGGRDQPEAPWHVRHLHLEAGEPSGPHQASHDDRGQQPGVDVAAGEDHADLPVAEAVGCSRRAAIPAAPAPSATTFSMSRSRFMASSTEVSRTVTISSTRSFTRRAVSWPATGTAIPSARVAPPIGRSAPVVATNIDGHRTLWAPMSVISGRSARATTAIPASRPPPPVGTTRESSSGWSSRSSRATVPWPATTAGSS